MNDLRKCRNKKFFKLPFILCIVVLRNDLLSWRRLPIQLGTSEATVHLLASIQLLPNILGLQ